MTIKFIAAIIESIYNNGRVTSDTKLDFEDFEQFSIAAAGDIIRKIFYDEKRAGKLSSFISEMVEIREFKVNIGERKRKTIDMKALNIPHGLGVLNIYPLAECKDEPVDYSLGFTRLETGSERIFNKKQLDDIGVNAFVQKGGSPELFCDDSIETVMVEGIFKSLGDDDEYSMDVPEYVAFPVINAVLGPTLKVAGWPVDMTNNSDPNVQTVLSKIAQPQSV